MHIKITCIAQVWVEDYLRVTPTRESLFANFNYVHRNEICRFPVKSIIVTKFLGEASEANALAHFKPRQPTALNDSLNALS